MRILFGINNKATSRPCVECGEESDCDDGDLCERCLDAQFTEEMYYWTQGLTNSILCVQSTQEKTL